MSGKECDFDGRIREAMQRCVRNVAEDGPYPSKNQLAQDCGRNSSTRYGHEIIDRCLQRNLLEIEEDHELAKPNAKGAVLLTNKGQQFLEWLNDGGGYDGL